MAVTRKLVQLNARELVSSADAMRMQRVASAEQQEDDAWGAAGAESPVGAVNGAGAPFSSAIRLPAIGGIAASFAMTLGAGRAYAYLPSFPGLTSDDSGNLVLQWAQQNVTFTTPDGSNPRIDLVVATPAMVGSDVQSRSTLVDPVARTIAPQNVNKTSGPAATIAVVAGTASATPSPPAVPANAIALFEVLVPAGATDSTTFSAARRLHRRALFPWSAMNGPITGCGLQWDLTADPTSASAAMSFNTIGLNGGGHRILIDGEVIVLSAAGSLPQVFADSTANPFASAAAAGISRIYYVYACGGRNLPQGARGYASIGGALANNFLPIVLVESTVIPREDGHPSANITTPRGTTQRGAVFVGIGFVYQSTTNRLPCIMEGDFTWGKLPIWVQAGLSGGSTALSNLPSSVLQGRRAWIQVNGLSSASGATSIAVNPGSFGNPVAALGVVSGTRNLSASSQAIEANGIVPLDQADSGVRATLTNLANYQLTIWAYSHCVQRVQLG